VTHGHFLSPVGLRNVVVLWRDPRDMRVSFYYHCFFVNERQNAGLVRLMNERCPFKDYTDIRANLPTFIRFVSQTAVTPSFSWPEFVSVWAHRPGTVQTSYQALSADTPADVELSFVCEGALGGWRRHFTADAEAALREGAYAEAMRGLRYEFENHVAGTP